MATDQKKKKTSKKSLLLLILGLLIAALIVGIAVRLLTAGHAEEDISTASESTELATADDTENAEETSQIEIPEKDIDWDALQEENADVYAWIYIPNTDVDYPIYQHPTDNDYYLDHNADGSSGYPGVIYSQQEYNSTDFTDWNTILYGHNMKNGSMFATLHNFEDPDFFKANRYVYIYRPDDTTLVYSVFAAYIFDDSLLPAKYDFETQEGFQNYLEMVCSIKTTGTQFDLDTINQFTDNSRILTLSTCISKAPANRWIVQALLVDEQ